MFRFCKLFVARPAWSEEFLTFVSLSGACVQGWENHLDSCYYVNALETDKLTWDSANEYCTNVTAKLVIIETQDEDDYIRTRIGEEDLMWIGLYCESMQRSNMHASSKFATMCRCCTISIALPLCSKHRHSIEA